MFGKSSRSRSQYESKQCQMITAGNDLKTIGGIRDVQLPLAVPAESLAEKVRRLLGKELAARL